MSLYFGIDTSNYTTSLAVFDSEKKEIIHSKILLPVKKGENGLRQSDVVFLHTRQLPQVFENLKQMNLDLKQIKAVGVSTTPRCEEKSYMPCFLVGNGVASAICSILSIEKFEFSHQQNHIAAALYSTEKLNFLTKKFIAFHISGGTTEGLIVNENIKNKMHIETRLIAKSLDAKAGQIIDRIGVLMGYNFPCGFYLDEESKKYQSDRNFKTKISIKDNDFNLSGIFNICEKAFHETNDKALVSRILFEHLSDTIIACLKNLFKQDEFKNLPVIFAGGVMANTFIKSKIKNEFKNVFFAEPVFSADNAAGCAILAYYNSINEVNFD